MLNYLVDAPSGIVLERVYDEFPRDTGIYGSFAQKPNVVGIPFLLDVWKRNLTELPALVAKIQSFYGGTLLDAERFLTDHDSATSSGLSARARTSMPGRASCRRSMPTTAGWSSPPRQRLMSASGSAVGGRATASSLGP